MKIGIIGLPNEESFKNAAEKGLEFLEFCINVNSNIEEFINSIDLIKQWIEKYDVSVGSIGRWGSDRIDSKGNVNKDELEISYKLIDAASELNCQNFVCGCNYIHELSYYENCQAAIEYFTKLLEYGNSKGVNISTYNCNWNNFVDNEMAWTIIHGYLKDLGIKFDPSHSRYAGRDYLKEMRDWGDRFYHVHIKGSLMIDGERLDDPPAGLDQTDWGTFMAILYSKNYKGGLSIEPHSHVWKGELGSKGIDFTINLLKTLIFK
ncbi:MAG: sugar phosphate isomerase/epimerase [Bacillota bacterium]|nr:sugar phosphate isomerase/epimerase [Bacillota bacterium]